MKLESEMIRSSESLAVNDYSSDAYSSQATGEFDKKIDTGNIEEAESSLRENGSLNYEEARALLGRYEYQKGNIEAALHVFEGIDLATVIPKMKTSLAQRTEPRKRVSHNYGDAPLSIHAVGLLLEAIYLKSKSLQILQRHKEAAQSCKIILDIVESSLPEGLPENFGTDCKLQETLNHAIELLPELWKLAGSTQEAVLSFRRALLHHQTLNAETTAKIQKDFAFFLLYNGGEEAIPPNLRSQMDTSFVPKNNIEEAILLLMILLRKVSLKIIKWDPLILDHLSYALSISNGLGALCVQLEELPPGIIDNKERYILLALCYHGQGDDLSALHLLKNIYKHDDPHCGPALLLGSKICGENLSFFEEGTSSAKRAIGSLETRCDEMVGIAYYLLGISISGHCRSAISDLERIEKQAEVIQCLETGGKITGMNDSRIVYNLSLENAEQRKLDVALVYAKRLVKLEGGSSVKGWILLARILSGQKRFSEGETVINAALEQTGNWDQGELLRTKARLQVAQAEIKNAIQTYTQILAVLQVQGKSFRSQKKNNESKHIFWGAKISGYPKSAFASLEELERFTDVIRRWDVNAVEGLPEYMKICFLGLNNSINEMGYHTLTNQGTFVIPHVQKAWIDYCEANLIEARWFNSGYTPTLEEYLNNSRTTVAIPVIVSCAYFLASNTSIEKELQNVIQWSAVVLRLADDLGTASAEIARGDVPKAVQCYMHETGVSEEKARAYIKTLIIDAYKKITKERIACKSPALQIFMECSSNLGRMGQITYERGDIFGAPDDLYKNHHMSLLFEPKS